MAVTVPPLPTSPEIMGALNTHEKDKIPKNHLNRKRGTRDFIINFHQKKNYDEATYYFLCSKKSLAQGISGAVFGDEEWCLDQKINLE